VKKSVVIQRMKKTKRATHCLFDERAIIDTSVSANKSYNVFFHKIKTRNIQNLNPIRLLISSPGGFMDFGVFFNGAAATFD